MNKTSFISWKVNDPVWIVTSDDGGSDTFSTTNTNTTNLEGIVAYLEGEETVGVRLTGTSVGLGITNVGGKFKCPTNGGLWTITSKLRKRQLRTKLYVLQ